MLDDGERLVPGFRDARALQGLGRCAAVVAGREVGARGRRHARRQPHARGGRPHPARRRGTAAHDVGRQAHDPAVDGTGHRGRDVPSDGRRASVSTAEESPPGNEDGELYSIGSRLRRREKTLHDEQLVCECELIGRSRLEETIRRRGTTNLDDIRRSLRLGMGPCQGGFCIYRATGILHGVGRLSGAEASASLRHFLQERWKGMWPISTGISSARPVSTTGSSKDCSTSSTCRPARTGHRPRPSRTFRPKNRHTRDPGRHRHRNGPGRA